MGGGKIDEKQEEREQMIAELESKCDDMARELFKVKQDLNASTSSKFPKRSKDESERVIADLTK